VQKGKNRRRVLFAISQLLEFADFALRECEFLAAFVERQVSLSIALPERFVCGSSFPEVTRQVSAVTEGIAQEERSLVRRVTPEQLGPVSIRPIYAFKPFVTSRLDIELPEG